MASDKSAVQGNYPTLRMFHLKATTDSFGYDTVNEGTVVAYDEVDARNQMALHHGIDFLDAKVVSVTEIDTNVRGIKTTHYTSG